MVELLVAGLNLRQISEQLEIGYETARTHFRRILAKTDTSSRSELIRLVTSGPITTLSTLRH